MAKGDCSLARNGEVSTLGRFEFGIIVVIIGGSYRLVPPAWPPRIEDIYMLFLV